MGTWDERHRHAVCLLCQLLLLVALPVCLSCHVIIMSCPVYPILSCPALSYPVSQLACLRRCIYI